MAARLVVFCYVSDLIDGIFRLALSDYHDPINIGNPREMTILEFANKILEITGAKSQIITKPLPVDDPKVRQPDIRRARTLLGWEPKIDFETGIRETILYFKEKLGIQRIRSLKHLAGGCGHARHPLLRLERE
jgi:dTDP-glucose 4,6-dehydratase